MSGEMIGAAMSGEFEAIGRVARAIGTEGFYRTLMRYVQALVSADLAMVMRYSRYSVPEYLTTDDLAPLHIQQYRNGLYRVDPIYRRCREEDFSGVWNIRDLCSQEEQQNDYFTIFLQMTGMRDDLVILFPAAGKRVVGLVFERKRAYTAGETERVRQMYPAFLGLHTAHQRSLFSSVLENNPGERNAYKIVDQAGQSVVASDAWRRAEQKYPLLSAVRAPGEDDPTEPRNLSRDAVLHVDRLDETFVVAPGGYLFTLEQSADGLPPVSYERLVDRFLSEKITEREHQIVRLILLGYPNKGIANSLGISVGNVKNHRQRLYNKLDITSERELFSNFVDFVLDK